MGTLLSCHEELSIVGLTATSSDDALSQIADRALRAGYVEESFADALVTRENAYPTGLPTPIPVAVPHADPEHVLKPGIGVAMLSSPVTFGEMGNGQNTVEARAVATLFIRSAEAHVETLQALVAVFQRPDWHDRAHNAPDAAALATVINEMMAESSS